MSKVVCDALKLAFAQDDTHAHYAGEFGSKGPGKLGDKSSELSAKAAEEGGNADANPTGVNLANASQAHAYASMAHERMAGITKGRESAAHKSAAAEHQNKARQYFKATLKLHPGATKIEEDD